MSPLPLAPPLVLALPEHGPFAEFGTKGTAWAIDEGRALLRHHIALLARHTASAGNALVELHIAANEAGRKPH